MDHSTQLTTETPGTVSGHLFGAFGDGDPMTARFTLTRRGIEVAPIIGDDQSHLVPLPAECVDSLLAALRSLADR